MGRGEFRKFPSKRFCLKLPKQFVGGRFTLSLVSGIENVFASEGYVTIFRRNFFVSQYRNISSRNPSVLCFRKLLVAKKFMEKKGEGGVSIISVEFFLCQSAEKFRRGNLVCLCFRVSKKILL